MADGKTLTDHNALGEELSARPVLLAGFLLLLPIQFVQFGIAQPVHIWAAIAMIYVARELRVSRIECYVFLLFIVFALLATCLDYSRIKAAEQIIKFVLVYPAFYLIGRFLGLGYRRHDLPYGSLAVLAFVLIEWAIQDFNVPVIYQYVDFSIGAIHGTFKERNWLATFVFFLSYLLYLKKPASMWSATVFVGLMLLVTYLTGSKTVLVSCGIGLVMNMPGRMLLKLVFVTGGTAFYLTMFSAELSGRLLDVRLQEERGLALQEGIKLALANPIGYGFGFVESYFSRLSFDVMGLGQGVNSLFLAPLDLWIIAGPAGLLLWLVFFLGIGVGAVPLLAPVAAWSLLNPLQQSEIVYFFCGMLVSWRGMTASRVRSADQSNAWTEPGAVMARYWSRQPR
jgi:hypothetical protein